MWEHLITQGKSLRDGGKKKSTIKVIVVVVIR